MADFESKIQDNSSHAASLHSVASVQDHPQAFALHMQPDLILPTVKPYLKLTSQR